MRAHRDLGFKPMSSRLRAQPAIPVCPVNFRIYPISILLSHVMLVDCKKRISRELCRRIKEIEDMIDWRVEEVIHLERAVKVNQCESVKSVNKMCKKLDEQLEKIVS